MLRFIGRLFQKAEQPAATPSRNSFPILQPAQSPAQNSHPVIRFLEAANWDDALIIVQNHRSDIWNTKGNAIFDAIDAEFASSSEVKGYLLFYRAALTLLTEDGPVDDETKTNISTNIRSQPKVPLSLMRRMMRPIPPEQIEEVSAALAAALPDVSRTPSLIDENGPNWKFAVAFIGAPSHSEERKLFRSLSGSLDPKEVERSFELLIFQMLTRGLDDDADAIAAKRDIYRQAISEGENVAFSPLVDPSPALQNLLARALEADEKSKTDVDLTTINAAAQAWLQVSRSEEKCDRSLRSVIHYNLAVAFRRRYVLTRLIEDLQRAEKLCAIALECEPRHLKRAQYLDFWALLIFDQVSQQPNSDEFFRGLQKIGEAFEQLKLVDRSTNRLQARIGCRCAQYYLYAHSTLGRADALQYAINALREALKLNPDAPQATDMLATTLGSSFRRTGILRELDESIELLSGAFTKAIASDPNRPMIQGNLGVSYGMRGERLRNIEDATRAVDNLTEATELMRADHPSLWTLRLQLAHSLTLRCRLGGVDGDLDRAIEVYTEIASLIPAAARPQFLSDYGSALSNRAGRDGDVRESQRAIALIRQAVAEVPAGSPYEAIMGNVLGVSLRTHFKMTHDKESKTAAVAAFRSAMAKCEASSINTALLLAENWGGWAFDSQSWGECVEAFQGCFHAMRRLVASQQTLNDKETALSKFEIVSSRLAYALGKLGRYEEAVEALDGGRGLVLAEALDQTKAELDALSHANPDLHKRYMEARESLQLNREIGSVSAMLSAKEASLAIDSLLTEIRSISGYERFLLPMQIAEAKEAARERPIVYLSATSAGGTCLIVRESGNVDWAELPNLCSNNVAERLDRLIEASDQATAEEQAIRMWQDCLEDTLDWLWNVALAEVTDKLAPANAAWIVAGGRIGMLPLFAAKSKSSASAALDRISFISLPNVRSIRMKRVADGEVGPGLVIEEPKPVTAPPLPGAVFESKIIKNLSNAEVLAGKAATHGVVLNALQQQRPFVHFAGHAMADIWNPLESGMLVADDQRIKVSDLMTRRCGAKLVVIAACQSGQIGLRLPDESFGLPAGLIQSGAHSVIASLWVVHDCATLLLMAQFYASRNTVNDAQSLQRAQIWLRDLTIAGCRTYVRSLPEGASAYLEQELEFLSGASVEPDSRPFAHSIYWAPFYIVGQA